MTKGQSLYEVIIALGVMIIVIVSLLSLASNSVKNARLSRTRTLATRHSQETLEWLRNQRDQDWDDFYSQTNQNIWCIISDPPSWESPSKSGDCNTDDIIQGSLFSREVEFSQIDANNIKATVRVFWEGKDGYKEIKNITYFTNWRAI